MRFEGKVAVVTGSGQGIGKSIALAFAAEGAKVVTNNRAKGTKGGDAATTASEIKAAGGLAVPFFGSVSDYNDSQKLVKTAVDHFGKIDILVNNAGIGIMKPVDQLTPAEWDATIRTNLSGVFYCCHEAIPFMRKRGGGYIFNISSLAGVNPFAGGSAYNASKFGVNGFSEAMMQDVRYDGIRVSYIMPGSVDTDFGGVPGNRSRAGWKLSGEDIAKAVVDLYAYPPTTLASRIELRPSQPPRKK